jgi:5-methylcytosine-specific restriction endonuclease McrA
MQECQKCSSKSIIIERHYEHWNVYECANCKYWTFLQTEDCCRKPDEIISIDHKPNGGIAIYLQCLNCGGCQNRNKPLSSKKFGDKIRSEFSNSRFEEFKENKENERQELTTNKAEYRRRNSKRYKYYEYLTSDKWKILREKVKERDEYLCQECKIEKAEEVHHLNYDNIFNEKLSDLISVCTECHKKIHQTEEKNCGQHRV